VVFERLRTETITALGRELHATVIEMRVPDTRQKKGTSTLRFYIGDDTDRLPLRIDSAMPMAGTMTLVLESVSLVR